MKPYLFYYTIPAWNVGNGIIQEHFGYYTLVYEENRHMAETKLKDKVPNIDKLYCLTLE